ncbi:hypothetical protein PIB30_081253, partial [Stylosanthes scabra]|nr:hypothetical protein [Stylosanthes scabra]
ELYMEFYSYGLITYVYVSRKRRRNKEGPVASIRFNKLVEARRAVDAMNGRHQCGIKIHFTMSRYRRYDSKGNLEKSSVTLHRTKIDRGWRFGRNRRISQKLEVRQQEKETKEVRVEASQEKRELLAQSLMGVNIKPIVLEDVQNVLLTECKGAGVVECRNVGPKMFLVIFELECAKEKVISDELMCSFTFGRQRRRSKLSPSSGDLKVGDRELECFFKEFSAETTVGLTPVVRDNGDLNFQDVTCFSLIEKHAMGINEVNDEVGTGRSVMMHAERGDDRKLEVVREGEKEHGAEMAQIDSSIIRDQIRENESEGIGLPLRMSPTNSDLYSCPFSPDFGP